MFHLHTTTRRVGGFTLLELVIVLALLVTVAAVVTPALMRSVGETRLKRAAETVRIELAHTRARAVEEGLTYQFLFEPAGGRFVSIPAEKDGEAPALGAASVAVDDHPRFAGRLPAGLEFVKTEIIGESRKLDSGLFAGMADADALAAVAWSEPVLFQSDGTASDSEVPVWNPTQGTRVDVSVRSLTGRASVGGIERGAGL